MQNLERQFGHFFIFVVIVCVATLVIISISPRSAAPNNVSTEVSFDVPQQYLVKVKKGSSIQEFSPTLIGKAKAADGEDDEYEWVKVNLVSRDQLQKISENGNVVLTQPDFKRRLFAPDDSYYNSVGSTITGQYDQWNLRKIGLTPTSDVNSGWNITTGSTQTIVAVIDSGISLTHPDIVNYKSGGSPVWGESNLWVNQNEIPNGLKATLDANSNGTISAKELIDHFTTNNYNTDGIPGIDYRDILAAGSVLKNNADNDSNGYVDDIFGYNFADNSNNPNEVTGSVSAGHGTHVSGIIAATTDNNSRVTPSIAGTCWSCQLMPLKVINSSGFGYDSDIAAAIDYAVENGAKIINMSLGGAGYSQILQDAITNAWNSGVLVVSAAGNDGASASDSYPSGSTNSLSVGATNYLDQIPSYSNTGGKLDIVAPGDYILSTYLQANGCLGISIYVCASGTSMASPHVAGVAALLYDLHKNDPSPWGPKEIRSALLKNATNLSSPGFDTTTGYGLLNAKNTLSATYSSDAVAPSASLTPFGTSLVKGTISINGTASDADLYIYTLSFARTSDNYVVKQYSGRTNVTSSLLQNVNTATISDGVYNISLRVEDFSGNISNASPISVTIDNTPPSTFSINTPANNSYSTNKRPQIAWQSSTDTHGVVYDVIVDGSTVVTDLNTTLYTLTSDLTEGARSIFINAKDSLGNTRSSSSITYTLDLTPPNTFIVSTVVNGQTPTFSFTATDTFSGVSYYQASIDGGGFVTVNSPYTSSALADGDHTITIRAFDGAGNSRDSSAVFTISGRNSYLKSKADFNFDGKVDLSDLSILAIKWLQSNSQADANGDGKTDLSDLSILASTWKQNF